MKFLEASNMDEIVEKLKYKNLRSSEEICIPERSKTWSTASESDSSKQGEISGGGIECRGLDRADDT